MIPPIRPDATPPRERGPRTDQDEREPAFRDELHRETHAHAPRPASKRAAAKPAAATPDAGAVAAMPAQPQLQPQLAPADRAPAQVAQLISTTVSRALAAFGRTETAAPVAAGTQPPPVAPAPRTDLAPPTPLELAVADLLEQLSPAAGPAPDAELDTDEPAPAIAEPAPLGAPAAAPAIHAADRTERPAAPAPIRELAPPPDAPANPSHVHLVLDESPTGERVVVTVAVRGSEVNVALRGGDDTTAAALARNAASLDHALRARGLDLNDFTAARDPRDDHRPARDDRERPEPSGEPFVLEEIV
jgi:hypothetical protein